MLHLTGQTHYSCAQTPARLHCFQNGPFNEVAEALRTNGSLVELSFAQLIAPQAARLLTRLVAHVTTPLAIRYTDLNRSSCIFLVLTSDHICCV